MLGINTLKQKCSMYVFKYTVTYNMMNFESFSNLMFLDLVIFSLNYIFLLTLSRSKVSNVIKILEMLSK